MCEFMHEHTHTHSTCPCAFVLKCFIFVFKKKGIFIKILKDTNVQNEDKIKQILCWVSLKSAAEPIDPFVNTFDIRVKVSARSSSTGTLQTTDEQHHDLKETFTTQVLTGVRLTYSSNNHIDLLMC